MIYSEDDFLQLSGLQHFVFCRRQWALIHIENQWEENYRTVDGTNRLSNHGRGLAIDINPLYNPWVHGTKVDPAEGRPYAFNRSKVKAKVPVITINDACYKLFRKHGFTWGGSWRSSKDYQHFEKVQK